MLDRALLAPHALARWAAADPDRTAVEHVDGTRLTYRELDDLARRWAGAFARQGIGASSHVATLLPNGFDAQQVMLGLAWLRAVEVPLNTALTGSSLQYALARAEATTVVTTADRLDEVAALRIELPLLADVVVVDGDDDGASGVVGRATLLDGAEPATDLAGPEVHDVACLLFTSGTTGPSKAVVTPWGVVHQFWSWIPDDTVAPGEGLFCALPLFHNSGRAGFNTALARGARWCFRERFSATSFWDDVRATGASSAALVGPLTSLLYAAPPRPDDADNPLRSVILGPMIADQADFERRFGVRAASAYGQTEIGCPLVTGWDHGPWANCGRARTTWPWPEVRIVDEHDEPVGPGVVGELVVRSAEPWSLNLGYHGMPEASIAAWRNGWFHTGDAFRCDEDGWYYFVDRLHDSIRRRGENISSFEVEHAVSEHADVLECAAVGIRGVHGDDEVMVAVIVRDPATFDPAELIEYLTPRMPRFTLPRYVEVLDDLPRNETTGRVRKNEIRARGLSVGTWDREQVDAR